MALALALLVAIATPPALPHRPWADNGCLELGEATQAFERAARAFDGLEIDNATTEMQQIEQTLGPCAWEPAARRLLARTYLLHGRLHLVAQRPTEATALFVLATRLDAAEVPDETEWPPPARAHYETARAQQGQRAAGTLTLRVTPTNATLWLDGRARGTGDTTLTEVTAGGHHLVARAEGYISAATVVDVHEPPLHTELSLFLEPLSAEANRVVPLDSAAPTTPTASPARPSLMRHWPWAALGTALIGGAALWVALERRDPTVNLVIGRPQ